MTTSGISRVKREQAERKAKKEAAFDRAALRAISKMEGDVPVTVNREEMLNLLLAKRFMMHTADYLGELQRVGTALPRNVRLADIPEATAPNKKALFAKSERQLMLLNLAVTIRFLLGCPGDNVDSCGVLWRIYEGLLDVEDGRRFYAFEPEVGRAGGASECTRYVMRKAGVAAAQYAYMLSGLSEQQALAKVMVHVNKTTPAHFGLSTIELQAETVGNWRKTFSKGRSGSDDGLRQFGAWITEAVQMHKREPTRLSVWAERLLHAAIWRE